MAQLTTEYTHYTRLSTYSKQVNIQSLKDMDALVQTSTQKVTEILTQKHFFLLFFDPERPWQVVYGPIRSGPVLMWSVTWRESHKKSIYIKKILNVHT